MLVQPEELPLSRRGDGDALLFAILLRCVGQWQPEWQIQVGRAFQHVISLQAGPGWNYVVAGLVNSMGMAIFRGERTH